MAQELYVGLSASFTKTVSEYDVYQFAGVTGDFNPAHIDAESAKNGIFKERIAHGMLSAGFISTVLGTKLPGPGTIYLSQNLNFIKAVKIGDTITAVVTVCGLEEKGRVVLSTKCLNQNGEIVVDGTAHVIAPK